MTAAAEVALFMGAVWVLVLAAGLAVAAAYDRWRGRDFDTHTDQALDMVADDEWDGYNR